MSFVRAFQADAFQGSAFQAVESFLHVTGVGAVADFRGEERNRGEQDAREQASRDDLTRIVNEAFEGAPIEVEPVELPETTAPGLPDYSMVEQVLVNRRAAYIAEHQRQVRKAINDQAALELLLMVT